MANSSRSALLKKWRKWKAKNPDFPLTVNANGQWSKTIKSRTHYFGPLETKDKALEVWCYQKEYFLAGLEPPAANSQFTVGDLAATFIADAERRRDRGEIAVVNARDLIYAANFVQANLRKGQAVEQLTPEDFSDLREAVTEKTNRNLRSQLNLIVQIRGMFRWGEDTDNGMGFYGPVRFGPRFRPPSAAALRKEKETSGRERFIDQAGIRALLKAAKPAMKCMILLGINCGFYAIDSIRLTFSRLHIDDSQAYHDFPRVKNGMPRKAVLWPETVDSIRTYVDHHRGDDESDYVILNQYGRPYNDQSTGRGIRTAFDKLVADTGVTVSPGTSIGSLRHVYGTVMDLSHDQQMIDLSMGHVPKAIQARVYSQRHLSELARLAQLAEIVHEWLHDGEDDGDADTIPFPAVG